MIIRGGENVYPAEIEQFLYQHPKIQEVEVFILYKIQHFTQGNLFFTIVSRLPPPYSYQRDADNDVLAHEHHVNSTCTSN